MEGKKREKKQQNRIKKLKCLEDVFKLYKNLVQERKIGAGKNCEINSKNGKKNGQIKFKKEKIIITKNSFQKWPLKKK